MQYCAHCHRPIQTSPSRFPRDFFCQCYQEVTFTIMITAADHTASLLHAIYAQAEDEYERIEVPRVFQKALKDVDLSL